MSQTTSTCACAPADTATDAAAAPRTNLYRRATHTVRETPEAFELDVFLPGVTRDGIEVSLEDDLLEIVAHRPATTPAGWRPLRQEIPTEDFRLGLRVNTPVNQAAIEAKVADGVLRLRLPKAEEAKPRTIAVS